MCDPVTVLYSTAALAGGYVATKALAPKIPNAPTPQDPAAAAAAAPGPAPAPTPPGALLPYSQMPGNPSPSTGGGQSSNGQQTILQPPAQVAVNAPTPPNIPKIKSNNSGAKSGPNASSASTLLTGPQGVDMTNVKIGRSTLLGM